MSVALDTLGYAKRLREAGVDGRQAEAHAEAARDFLVSDLATKADLKAEVADLKAEIAGLEARTKAEIVRLEAKIDQLALTLTVRLGGMLVVAVGILAAILRLS